MPPMTEPQQPQIGSGYWYSKWIDADGSQRMKRFGNTAKVSGTVAARRFKNWKHDWDRNPALQNPARYKQETMLPLIDAYMAEARQYYRQVDAFAAGPEPQYSETGEADNMEFSLRVLKDLFAELHPQNFTPQDLEKCQKEMIERNLARTTINARINRIRRFFKWLTRKGHVRGMLEDLKAVAPIQRGRTAAPEPAPIKAVHRHEVDSVFTFMSPTIQSMVDVEWLAGMRPGEVVVMRTGDIDMSGELWIYSPAMHKTKWRGKTRKIVLGPQCQDIIRPLLKTDLQAFIFSPRQSREASAFQKRSARKTPVQPSQIDRTKENPKKSPGDRYTTHSYRRSIHNACDAASKCAGVAPLEWSALRWSPNQLRHACATRLEKRYGLEVARAVLGHSVSETTEGYVHADTEKAERVMGEVG
jgi:integrase